MRSILHLKRISLAAVLRMAYSGGGEGAVRAYVRDLLSSWDLRTIRGVTELTEKIGPESRSLISISVGSLFKP